jgi:hypothetical protein
MKKVLKKIRGKAKVAKTLESNKRKDAKVANLTNMPGNIISLNVVGDPTVFNQQVIAMMERTKWQMVPDGFTATSRKRGEATWRITIEGEVRA